MAYHHNLGADHYSGNPLETELRAIRESCEAKTSAAAQYRDAPHISRSFVVFDARTGIAAKHAHQVPTCLLRQVVGSNRPSLRIRPTSPTTVDHPLFVSLPRHRLPQNRL